MTSTRFKQIYEGHFKDLNPDTQAAGILIDPGERIRPCVEPELHMKRPVSPASVRKFRDTYRPAPAERRVFYGVAGDQRRTDTFNSLKHGVMVKHSQDAGEVVYPAPLSRFANNNKKIAESLYASNRKAPLGVSHDQRPGLPVGFDPTQKTLGVKYAKGEGASPLVNPPLNPAQVEDKHIEGHDQYIKSHNRYGTSPGAPLLICLSRCSCLSGSFSQSFCSPVRSVNPSRCLSVSLSLSLSFLPLSVLYQSFSPITVSLSRSYYVGEHKNRVYDLNFNPKDLRGKPSPHENTGKNIKKAMDWVTETRAEKATPMVNKRVDEFRERSQHQIASVHDPIKKTIEHLSPEHVFGVLVKPDPYGAGDVLHDRLAPIEGLVPADKGYVGAGAAGKALLRGKDRARGLVALVQNQLKKLNYQRHETLWQAFQEYDLDKSGFIGRHI